MWLLTRRSLFGAGGGCDGAVVDSDPGNGLAHSFYLGGGHLFFHAVWQQEGNTQVRWIPQLARSEAFWFTHHSVLPRGIQKTTSLWPMCIEFKYNYLHVTPKLYQTPSISFNDQKTLEHLTKLQIIKRRSHGDLGPIDGWPVLAQRGTAFPWGSVWGGGWESGQWWGCVALISSLLSPEVKASHFPRSHQAICKAFIGLINARKYTDPKVRSCQWNT